MAPELLEVLQGEALSVLGMEHLLKSVSLEGGQRPQHPHTPYPGTAPFIYPKTAQQLLTGPEPDLSRGPGAGPGYRKQKKTPVLTACWPSL